MNITEVKEFLKDNESDPEVTKFIDSISDKRVNQATENIYKNKLPSLVEAEVTARMEREAERRENLKAEDDFKATLQGRLKEMNVPEGIGAKFLNDLGVNSTEEEIESRFTELATFTEGVRAKALKSQYSTNMPKTSSSTTNDMKSQVLSNLGL